MLSRDAPRKLRVFTKYDDSRFFYLSKKVGFYRKPIKLHKNGVQVYATVSRLKTNKNLNPIVRISLDGTPAAIRLSFGTMRRLCGDSIEGFASEDQALYLENAVADWIEELETQTGIAIRIFGIETDNIENDLDFSLEIQVKSEKKQKYLTSFPIYFQENSANKIFSVLERYRAKNQLSETLTLNCRHCLMARQYSIQDLRSLCIGDAIVLSRKSSITHIIIEQGWRIPVTQEGQNLKVFGNIVGPIGKRLPVLPLEFLTQEQKMMETSGTENQDELAASPDAVDEIMVTLEVVSGIVPITVGEIRELDIGSVVALSTKDADGVDLVVNGQKIGEGKLIIVGDTPAVEVTRLAR